MSTNEAERRRTRGLEAASQIEHAQDVAERLLAGGPDRDARVGARRLEELRERVGDGPAVAPDGAACRECDSASATSRVSGLSALSSRRRSGCNRPMLMTKREERVVADREERAAQGRVDAELVVGPFDGRERVANREHLFALVKRSTADQHVRDVAHFERAHVRPRDVLSELLETLE